MHRALHSLCPRVVGPAAVLALVACGATQPTTTPATLSSVNGATYPVLLPRSPLELVGSGFGASQDTAAVLVSGPTGWITCDASAWSDAQVSCTLPDSARSGSVTVVIGSDTVTPLPLIVRDTAAFDANASLWHPTAALPAPRGGAAVASVTFPGAASSGVAIVYGGVTGPGTFAESTVIGLGDPDGTVGNWSALPDTAPPFARLFAAGAGADRANAALTSVDAAVYVLGGVDSTGRTLSDVLYLPMHADGSHDPWTGTVALPDALMGVAAVVARDHVFIAGGVGLDGFATDAVYVATVNPDGSLTGWFAGPPLPVPLAFGTLLARDLRLYMIGGDSGAVGFDGPAVDTTAHTDGVFSIPLSPGSGYFTATSWQRESSSLVHARAGHAAFMLDNGVLIDGGAYAGAPGAGEAEFAPFIGDSLGPFAALGAQSLTDLGGAGLALAPGVMMVDAHGIGHPLIVGGITLDGQTSDRVWFH